MCCASCGRAQWGKNSSSGMALIFLSFRLAFQPHCCLAMPPGIRGRKSYNGDFFEVRPTLVSAAIFSSVSLMVRASPAARQRPAFRRRIFPVFVIQLSPRVPDALGQTVGRLTLAFRPHCIHQCRRVWSALPTGVCLFMTILHYFAIKRLAHSRLASVPHFIHRAFWSRILCAPGNMEEPSRVAYLIGHLEIDRLETTITITTEGLLFGCSSRKL